MATVAEIQQAIMNLPKSEYTQLMRWFHEYDWEVWDREFEEDVLAGKLDFLKAEVEQAKREGTLGEISNV